MGINFREWGNADTNCSSVQIFVGLIFVGVAGCNSQTSQLGSGEWPRMCTMQTARAMEDPFVHDEIRWSIPTQTSHQFAQQPLTLQVRPTWSRRVTVASSN